MKKIINSTIAIILAFFITSSMSIAGDRNIIFQMLGQGLGAYGGAKLCGGGAAKQIACGTVGSLLGSRLLNPNHSSNSSQYRPQYQNRYQSRYQNRYQQRVPQYQNRYQQRSPQRYVPIPPIYTQSCKTVAVQVSIGVYAERIACRMSNGSWKFVR